jgi:hypothetical protein
LEKAGERKKEKIERKKEKGEGRKDDVYFVPYLH